MSPLTLSLAPLAALATAGLVWGVLQELEAVSWAVQAGVGP